MPTSDEQVIQDGQRAVAVTEVSGDFIYDGGATDAYCIVNNNGTAQRALKVANVGEGGGGSVTVDQTYDATSTNAQSGTAVAEAVAPALKNTAVGVKSLTILGIASTYPYQINIGESAVGGKNTVCIGHNASAHTNTNCVLIGQGADSAKDGGIAIGRQAKVTAENAIQLGTIDGTATTNSTAKTLQVYTYQLLDGNTGLIPPERLGTGYDATKTQVLKNVNGTLTWVDE